MTATASNEIAHKAEERDASISMVQEGSAKIFSASSTDVFYNPVQQFNRDLSVLAIQAWSDSWSQIEMARLAKKNQPRVIHENTNTDGRNGRHVHPQPHMTSAALESSGFTVLEALSATGLRAIRYAKEIPNVHRIIANDLSLQAIKQIERNIEHNQVSELVKTNHADARAFLYATKLPMHVIDLDPYGSATPFMDSAAQAIEDGGLLLVTCTDLAVLAGDCHPEKCYSQYGGTILKQCEFCHEQALRLVLHMIASTCARYGKAIVPLLSLSIDFYVRIFVRVEHKPRLVKDLLSQTMLTFQCTGCRSFFNQRMGVNKSGSRDGLFRHCTAALTVDRLCEHCGSNLFLGGPMYGGEIHDHKFVDSLLLLVEAEEVKEHSAIATLPRMKGMLTLAREELTTPHYWSLSRMNKVLHSQLPSQSVFKSALLNAGYQVSETHTGPGFFKTDAPGDFLWDVMRAWIKLHPIREASIQPNTPGANILSRREPLREISFEHHPESIKVRKEKIIRFQLNPTENWGPKSAARNTNSDTGKITKRKHNQL